MKNKFIYTILLSVGMLFNYSCTNLEEKPVGILSPDAFSTPSDLMLSVNGGYSLLGHEQFWGRKLSLTLLLRGDMATIGDMGTSSRRIEVDQMSMSANNGMVSAFWPKGHEIIGAANVAIEGAKLVNGDEAEINAIIAEAYFLRAFVYYNFVRLFGALPYVDEGIDNPDDAYNMQEIPAEEIYAGIIEDLEFAKQWLPEQSRMRSRPSKGTAAGFLASVYLTTEDFAKAYEEAKYVIDNSGAFGYNLEGEFADLFDPSVPEASKEVLFEIDFKGGDGGGVPSSLGGANTSTDFIIPVTGPRGDQRFGFAGWSVAVPALKVFESWDEKDYRRSVSFDTVMVVDGNTLPYTDFPTVDSRNVARPYIGKYFRSVGQSNTPTGNSGRDSEYDYPIMRYAEVLLIAAEALNETSGPNAEAIGYVNSVRERARRELDGDPSNDNAFPANVSGGVSKDELRTIVLEERRLELAFEFGRWFDIKRRQMAPEAFGVSGLEQQSFDVSKDYLMPKYQQDVDRMPNVSQNQGY
ncbi:RagB/SusD family nutrient uptake outer membrane protein [Flammeovirga sp. OC4]|uniref:RagB/SusD family nutrient uptake outer membrane protein n=1 Tax=Flammeovirga sp. OC4 TaxID=1382345 RepID=UPI0005C7620D|nr:RagB/SusD family nutrient uptake outer membrane protein [Flammeovirga sp. OC4]